MKSFLLILIPLVLSSCEMGYKNDGKEVTYHSWNEGTGHTFFRVKADPATFEDLGDNYGRDKHHAFLEGSIIEGADGATFKYLGHCYSVDANHVFCYDTIMSTADPKSFKVHSALLTEDKKDYYWCGNAIQVVDKKTFIVLGDIDNWETLWGKDKKNGYYLGSGTVSLADVASFHPIKVTRGMMSGAYAADKKRVYFKNHVVEGADPATFREVSFYVGQDKNRVYSEWHPTEIKDFASLKEVGRMYTDGHHIYSRDLVRFDGADPDTFESLSDNWYADKQHIWWTNTLVKKADVQSFEPVVLYTFCTGTKESMGSDFNYGKDAYHVFFRDSIIEGADPATFEKIDFDGSWTVFDKNHIYEGKNSEKLQKYLKAKNKNNSR